MTYVMESLPCPHCQKTIKIEITEDEKIALIDNHAYIQDALSRFSPGVRERFLTGFCEQAWDEMFGDE